MRFSAWIGKLFYDILIDQEKGRRMESTTLSSKFQVVIPKGIRNSLMLQPGQRFAVVRKGDNVVLVPIGNIQKMRGTLTDANASGYRDRSDTE